MKLLRVFVCVVALLSAHSKADTLKVMAYNIMQLNVQDWDQANRAQRLPNVISQLSDSPDVILISEAFSSQSEAALTQLAQLYPYQTPNVGEDCSGAGWQSLTGNCSNSPFVIRGGVVILSKYPIITQKAHVFNNSLTDSWDYLANKGFAYVEIEKHGKQKPFLKFFISNKLQASEESTCAVGKNTKHIDEFQKRKLRWHFSNK